MAEKNLKKTKGQCLCGQVQFEIHGELRDIVNCHCSKCRRFHGNFGAYTSVKGENLKITEPKDLKWYESVTDETANVRRGFCSTCGSSLFWHPKNNPHISIAAGSLESPTNLKTIGHIWCSQKSAPPPTAKAVCLIGNETMPIWRSLIRDYYQIEDDLPRFDEQWSQ